MNSDDTGLESVEIAQLKAAAAKAKADAAQALAEAAEAELQAALAAKPVTSSPAPLVMPPAVVIPRVTAGQINTVIPAATTLPETSEVVPTTEGAHSNLATSVSEGAVSDVSDVTGSDSVLSASAQTIAASYNTGDKTLPLGALLDFDGAGEAQAHASAQIGFTLSKLNRHGLITGATGTGKTKTLQGMAEALSQAGVPVFLTDIKGDLTGLAEAGKASESLTARCASIGQNWQSRSFPVELFSLGGFGPGSPVRATLTDFGPLLLSKALGLNSTQESSLTLIFHWADKQGLPIIDLKDLQSVIAFLTSEDGKEELKGIGGLSTATAGVILREVVKLIAQGAEAFFGEPAFETSDLIRTTSEGFGVLSLLELPQLQDRPSLFSTFLMWLLAELFQELPEVGDLEKPKLVFFFDEAHLLFNGASKEFLQQIVQTVRLIRSKGVGVFFVTQSPKDIPADVLAQLGNRVQHALRAFTPEDAAALKAAVRTFPKTDYDLEELLQSLGTGEAVVTVLNEKGAPTPVAWTRVRAPESSMDPADGATLAKISASSLLASKYQDAVDRESAYELMTARLAAEEEAELKATAENEKAEASAKKAAAKTKTTRKTTAKSGNTGGKAVSRGFENFIKSAGTQLGREFTRGLFGTRKRG